MDVSALLARVSGHGLFCPVAHEPATPQRGGLAVLLRMGVYSQGPAPLPGGAQAGQN